MNKYTKKRKKGKFCKYKCKFDDQLRKYYKEYQKRLKTIKFQTKVKEAKLKGWNSERAFSYWYPDSDYLRKLEDTVNRVNLALDRFMNKKRTKPAKKRKEGL